MRVVRLVPGRAAPADAEGGILARDVTVAGAAWNKGRRLSAADLGAFETAHDVRVRGLASAGRSQPGVVPLIIAEAGDLHEDEAARRIARAVAGPGLDLRGPMESRVNLVAACAGVMRVDVALLARIDRWDPVAVFTGLDGQIVAAGTVVASAKVGPHVVSCAIVERVEGTLGPAAARGRYVVRVDAFARRRIAVLVKDTIAPSAGSSFQANIAVRVEDLGSDLAGIRHVADDPDAIAASIVPLLRGPDGVDVILTAGAASTDPGDAFFVAVERLRGRIVSRGVPAHPGSMLWVARIGAVVLLGLPTCGAYSKATAVDLLLPWILAGAPADRRTIARLGHGGLLTRDMRFRFPAYARSLEAPEG